MNWNGWNRFEALSLPLIASFKATSATGNAVKEEPGREKRERRRLFPFAPYSKEIRTTQNSESSDEVNEFEEEPIELDDPILSLKIAKMIGLSDPPPPRRSHRKNIDTAYSTDEDRVMSAPRVCGFKSNLHRCTFENGEPTIASMGRLLCEISSDIKQIKDSLKVSPIRPRVENILNVKMDGFPLRTLDDLENTEKKLKSDKKYYDNLVQQLAFAAEGTTTAKVTTSAWRKLCSDELCQKLSWKGQKGKLAATDLILVQMLTDAVKKKLPKCEIQDVKAASMPWLAQAKHRLNVARMRLKRSSTAGNVFPSEHEDYVEYQ